MRRTLLTWSAVVVLLIGGFAASVVALNADLYSAHGFVGRYLEALERHDTASALALPGVRTGNDAADDLLTGDALGDLDDVRVVSDTPGADGTHTVVVEYDLSAEGAEATTARSEFIVARNGTRFGLFPQWRFVTSPLNTVSVTVLHDDQFRVNGYDVTTTTAADTPATYLVFAPGLYVVDHESTYLTAAAQPVEVSEIGGITDVAVDVQANEAFVTEVQENVSEYLQECTTQDVLMPTGCPFGQAIANRVNSPAAWSMVADPVVTIVPGVEPGSWAVPRTPATAHIVVEVQAYRDGSISTFDEDVPFTVAYTLTFQPNNSLLITAVYE
ncbi:hypothetical protein HD599_003317 [Conyzicola lurida]|uniref:Uncharacterized protein n=1 Tax=Conyzicola lurida TaxID=1172621 RepID=A0A841ARU4_9MICO|nr:hypothetical protein [Conyzicola lurida]MBB5844994.1 hypothetical protein [Conyzicola lurida]